MADIEPRLNVPVYSGYSPSSSQVMRLEASLLRCEQQRDELSSAVFHVRAESQGKIRHLRETVQV